MTEESKPDSVPVPTTAPEMPKPVDSPPLAEAPPESPPVVESPKEGPAEKPKKRYDRSKYDSKEYRQKYNTMRASAEVEAVLIANGFVWVIPRRFYEKEDGDGIARVRVMRNKKVTLTHRKKGCKAVWGEYEVKDDLLPDDMKVMLNGLNEEIEKRGSRPKRGKRPAKEPAKESVEEPVEVPEDELELAGEIDDEPVKEFAAPVQSDVTVQSKEEVVMVNEKEVEEVKEAVAEEFKMDPKDIATEDVKEALEIEEQLQEMDKVVEEKPCDDCGEEVPVEEPAEEVKVMEAPKEAPVEPKAEAPVLPELPEPDESEVVEQEPRPSEDLVVKEAPPASIIPEKGAETLWAAEDSCPTCGKMECACPSPFEQDLKKAEEVVMKAEDAVGKAVKDVEESAKVAEREVEKMVTKTEQAVEGMPKAFMPKGDWVPWALGLTMFGAPLAYAIWVMRNKAQ